VEKTKNNGSLKRNFLPCLKGYTFQTIITPLLMVGEVVLEVIIPLMMAKALNNIQSGNPQIPYLIDIGLKMVVIALGSLLCGMLAARFASVSAIGFAKNLRKKVFYRIQDFSFSNIDSFSTASLVTRSTTDITNIQSMFMQFIRMIIRAPLMFILATVMAFSLDPELALVFVVVIPILFVFIMIIQKKAFPRFQRMMKSFDGLNADVQEDLIGIRVVKSFVREDYEKAKFLERAEEVTKAQISAEKLVVFVMPVMQLIMQLSKLAITGIGGTFLIGGKIEVGDLTAMISYAVQILNSLLMFAMLAVTFIISKASVARINEVLDTQPDIVSPKSDLTVTDGSIEFENVGFTYSSQNENLVLSNINLHIKSGETVGIIAGTGGGKSTLVQLIPRLYDVSEGKITVSGKNVKDYSLKNLRDGVAMVLQKNVLFSGTIKENLLWGNENATDEEIFEACRHAQADAFIRSFPDGYDTVLGQGGVNVSGGQKQRLCIARALIKKPKILILDDSTSAVDTMTDSKIREAFKSSLPDTTKLIIAQRVASIMESDKIIVMDEGKIIDVGNHNELLNRCEIYKEVYESQVSEVN